MSGEADETLRFVRTLAKRLKAGTIELPSFPDVTLRVRRALEDPEATAETVARVIGSDPALSAKVLRIANSALLSRGGNQVTSLRQAVQRLGFRMVRNTALTAAVEQLYQAATLAEFKPRLRDLWQHSVRVAAMAYVLAKRFKHLNPDEALLAGLLHDIGALYSPRLSVVHKNPAPA